MARSNDTQSTKPAVGGDAREIIHKRDPLNKLDVWMKDNGYTDETFGKALRPKKPISKRSIYRWLNEGKPPALELAQLIYDFTDGYVGLMDWHTSYTKEKKAKVAKALGRSAKVKPKPPTKGKAKG